MAADQAVMLGLLGVTAVSAYYAMTLSRSESEWYQTIGFLFFGNSLAFLGLIVYSASLLVESGTAGITSTLLNAGLLVMTWVLVLSGGILFARGLWTFISTFYDTVMEAVNRGSRRRH